MSKAAERLALNYVMASGVNVPSPESQTKLKKWEISRLVLPAAWKNIQAKVDNWTPKLRELVRSWREGIQAAETKILEWGKDGEDFVDVVRSMQELKLGKQQQDMMRLEPIFENLYTLAKTRAKTSAEKSRETELSIMDDKVWRFLEEGTPITGDTELAAVAAELFEVWRDMTLNWTRNMLRLRNEVRKLGEEIHVYDNQMRGVGWYPVLPGYKWSKKRQLFRKIGVKGKGKWRSVEAAYAETKTLWLPRYYRQDHWHRIARDAQANIDALNRLRLSDKPNVPGFELEDGKYTHKKTGTAFDTKEDAIDYELELHNARLRDAQPEIAAIDAPSKAHVGMYAHLERTRETNDPDYLRHSHLLIDTVPLYWSRFAEITSLGQRHPVSGDYPRLRPWITKVRDATLTQRESDIREWYKTIEPYNIGEDAPFGELTSFQMGKTGTRDAMSNLNLMNQRIVGKKRRIEEAGGEWNIELPSDPETLQVDVGRMMRENENLTTERMERLADLGFVKRIDDGYEMGDRQRVVGLLAEYFGTLSNRERIIVDLIRDLSSSWTEPNSQIQANRFMQKLDNLTTTMTLGLGAVAQNLVEVANLTTIVDAKNVRAALGAVTDKRNWKYGQSVGTVMKAAFEYLAGEGFATSYLKQIGWPWSEAAARNVGALAGEDAAKHAIRDYIADQSKRNTERLTELRVNYRSIDDFIENKGETDLEQVFDEAHRRILDLNIAIRGVPRLTAPEASNIWVENIGSELAAASQHVSNLIFFEYNALTLPKFLVDRHPVLKMFTKYTAWPAQKHRQMKKQFKYAAAQAKDGNYSPALRMAKSLMWVIPASTAYLMVFGALRGRNNDEKEWADWLQEGIIRAQVLGFGSVIWEALIQANGSPLIAERIIADRLGGAVTVDVLAGVAGKLLTGDIGGAGQEAVRHMPYIKEFANLRGPADAIGLTQPR